MTYNEARKVLDDVAQGTIISDWTDLASRQDVTSLETLARLSFYWKRIKAGWQKRDMTAIDYAIMYGYPL